MAAGREVMINASPKDIDFSASQAMYAATRLIIEGLARQGTKPLGMIASPTGGGTPSRSNSGYFTGNIPWITVADLKLRQFAPQPIATAREFITEDALEHSAARLLPAGSVVLATRVSVGKVGIAQVPLATNQDFSSFVPTPGLNNRFLAYCLIASASKMQEATRGTTIKGFKRDRLLCLELPFPDEIAQRHVVHYLDAISEKGAKYAADFASRELPQAIRNVPRIVARIEELAARIEEARYLRRRAIEESKALLSATSKYFFSEDCTKFQKGKLEEFTRRITKGESPEWQGFIYQDSGPLFVRSENVLWGELDLSKQVHIPAEFHKKLSRSQLHPGDVLINLVGASIGRSCVVPDNIGEANVNQAVAVISPDTAQLASDYLMHFLISAPAQSMIQGGKVETARPNISLGDLRELVLPVPPLEEQRRIVVYLDDLQTKLDALKCLQTETAAELDALMPSILERAFRGEL
jgi:type I restriction enzyme S subunit